MNKLSDAFRIATPQDAEQVVGIYAPFVSNSATSFETIVPSTQEMSDRIVSGLEKFPWLVCEHEGVIMGYAYSSKHDDRGAYQWTTNTTIYVDPNFHHRGIGRGLYTSLFNILRLQGYFLAVARITMPNTPSIGLHESMGFARVGVVNNVGFKLGEWYDVGWWQRPLQAVIKSPAAPLTISQLSKAGEWRTALQSGRKYLKIE